MERVAVESCQNDADRAGGIMEENGWSGSYGGGSRAIYVIIGLFVVSILIILSYFRFDSRGPGPLEINWKPIVQDIQNNQYIEKTFPSHVYRPGSPLIFHVNMKNDELSDAELYQLAIDIGEAMRTELMLNVVPDGISFDDVYVHLYLKENKEFYIRAERVYDDPDPNDPTKPREFHWNVEKVEWRE